MTTTSDALAARLRAYGTALDEASARHTDRAIGQSSEGQVFPEAVDLELSSATAPRHGVVWLRIGASAAAAAIVIGLAATLGRTAPDSADGTPGEEDGLATTRAEDGCFGPPATLYLGEPSSHSNLAVSSFILSLPAGTSVDDVAEQLVVQAVLGLGCGGDEPGAVRTEAVDGGSLVSVSPPAVPARLDLHVDVVERENVVGVTAVTGLSGFDVHEGDEGVPVLEFGEGIPRTAATAVVRFRKGQDVWEIREPTSDGLAVPLEVPDEEVDPSGAAVDWVLFVLLDADGRVVDVGGTTLR